VVLVCVGYDRELRELLAPGGGCATRAGTIVAVLRTVHPATVVELAKAAAERGVHVSTPPSAAAARRPTRARCSRFVGGPSEVVARLTPVLSAYSADIVHTGPAAPRRSPRPRTT
jgi:3-hydroxyisobutyrate dehydrogenase-like beta-hydroxyacid dehydrogenase